MSVSAEITQSLPSLHNSELGRQPRVISPLPFINVSFACRQTSSIYCNHDHCIPLWSSLFINCTPRLHTVRPPKISSIAKTYIQLSTIIHSCPSILLHICGGALSIFCKNQVQTYFDSMNTSLWGFLQNFIHCGIRKTSCVLINSVRLIRLF